MACCSSSIANLFSFFTPSKPPPPSPSPKTTPPQFSIPLSSKNKDGGLAPLVISSDGLQHHSLSSSSSSSSCSSELMSVVCPSLAYANTLFFRSAYNVMVIVDENEHEEKLVNRFRREVMRAGVIQECKRRRFHENKQDEKKRKTREAAKRNRRRRPQARGPMQDRQEGFNTKKVEVEDDDNWDLPEGDLPY